MQPCTYDLSRITKNCANRQNRGWPVSTSTAGLYQALGSALLALRRCRAMDGLANALVSSAATDVAAHGVVNLRVAWRCLFRKQRHCGHDLSRLTVPTLRNVDFHPSLLDGMSAVGGKPLDGGDLFARDGRYGRHTRTGGFTFDVYRASSAQRHAAPELRASHVQCVPQYPEERHLGANIDGLRLAVKYKTDSHDSPGAKIPPVIQNSFWKTEISYNNFADASATVKLFGWRLRVGRLGSGFILDGEQFHFEYQRGVRTDVLAGAAVPVCEISGKEQLPF